MIEGQCLIGYVIGEVFLLHHFFPVDNIQTGGERGVEAVGYFSAKQVVNGGIFRVFTFGRCFQRADAVRSDSEVSVHLGNPILVPCDNVVDFLGQILYIARLVF